MNPAKIMAVQIKHQDLFPTRLWQVDLAVLSPHFGQWIEWIENARKADLAPWGSNRGGWNSAKTLFDEPVFEPLVRAVSPVMKAVMKQMGMELSPRAALKYHAWANVLDKGGFNMQHVHQNTLLSACFYLSAPTGSSPIVFRDPRPGVVFSPMRGKGINGFSERSLLPQAGQLVVFPNWLEHRVEIHQAEASRVSIAFNVTGATMVEESANAAGGSPIKNTAGN